MRLGHRSEALEAEIGPHLGIGHAGRTVAVLAGAAVNPAGREPDALGRDVVVEQGFGGVQDLLPADPTFGQVAQQVVEIAWVGLVGADVLGGVDRIEAHPSFRLLCANEARSMFDRITSL